MDVDAHAMTQPVTHLAGESARGKGVLGHLVHLRTGDARFYRGLHLLVGFAQRFIGGAHPRIGLADEHGAGHVRAIPVSASAEIHDHALSRLKPCLARDGMRARAVGAAGHDGGERQAGRAMTQHPVLKLDLHLPFGHARLHVGDDIGERRIGDGLGRFHARNLRRLLDRAQRADEVRGLAQLRGRRRLGKRDLKRTERRKRHGVLDAKHDAFRRRRAGGCGRMPTREHVGNPFAVTLTRVIDGDDAFALRRLARRAAVAGIGVQHRVMRRHQKRMRLLVVEHVVESRQPFDARRVAHQKRADAVFRRRVAQPLQTPCGLGFHAIRQ